MSAELEARIVELELRFTAQQDELEQLHQVVFSQSKEIERLRAEVDALKQYLSSEPWSAQPMPHERPPHY